MRIFVTGATGVMGKVLVPQLVETGHKVTALSRSPHNDEMLSRMGAHPGWQSIFDVDALKQALRGYDAIFHLANKIPPTMQMGKQSPWLENDRLRRDGTRNIVTAALAARTVHTMIYPSFDFLYPSSGSTWLDVQSSRIDPAPMLVSNVDAEEAVARFAVNNKDKTHRGISLRMGMFYGPESPAAWEMLSYARKGIGVLHAVVVTGASTGIDRACAPVRCCTILFAAATLNERSYCEYWFCLKQIPITLNFGQ